MTIKALCEHLQGLDIYMYCEPLGTVYDEMKQHDETILFFPANYAQDMLVFNAEDELQTPSLNYDSLVFELVEANTAGKLEFYLQVRVKPDINF